jgi:hypothetical protein
VNELTRRTPFGAIQPHVSREIAVVSRDYVVAGASQLIDSGRRQKKIGLGPYLLALSFEARDSLGIPATTKVTELDSFDFGHYGLTIDGVIGVHFSERLRGREMGLIDLCAFQITKG